ncbi:MAG: methylenetetrahydrofolate reductase [NAD(P)H] [Alphaproteobacteria bacterium]
MLLDNLPHKGDIDVSFEYFPPKTEKAEENLWNCMMELAPLKPKFVSVTYGAGGSTRERTHDTLKRIKEETKLEAAAHLTCVNASKDEIHEIVDNYWNIGIRHIVALRGDMPDGGAYQPHPQGYAFAADLVEGLAKRHNFEISVAVHPEVHPESRGIQQDLDNLKRKYEAGATRAISQFFFYPELYLRFRDKAVAQGIDIDMVPGILPVTNYKRLVELAANCGASLPAWMGELFEGLGDNPETRRMIAVTAAATQVMSLWNNGVKHFHFYTLNRPTLTRSLCHLLNVRDS